MGGTKFPHRPPRTIRLWSATMTKQFAIAARDHGEAILDQVRGRVAFRRGLPVVAPDGLEPEDHFGDLPLACAGAVPVDRLQHAPSADQLLTREARVGRNGAAVQGGQKPADGFHAVEALDSERDHGHEWLACRSVSGKRQVQALPVAQVVQDVKAVFGGVIQRSAGPQEGRAIRSNGGRRQRQYHRSGIFFRKPEYLRLGGLQSRGDKEIATPIACRRARSAMVTLSTHR